MDSSNTFSEDASLAATSFESHVDSCLDDAPLAPVSSQSFWNIPSSSRLWILYAATSIYTSKRLMVFHSYHYPLTLSFRFYTGSIIAYTIYLAATSRWTDTRNVARFASHWLPRREIWISDDWKALAPAAAMAAISMPLLMEGILRMPSLAHVVMLFPVAYYVNTLLLTVLGSIPSKIFPWEILVAILLSTAIPWNDFRPVKPGVAFTTTGLVLAGASRTLLSSLLCNTSRDKTERANLCHTFCVMTLISGFLCSGTLAYLIEEIFPAQSLLHPTSTTVLMCINILSSIGASISVVSGVVVYSPILLIVPTISFSKETLPASSIFASACCSIIVMIGCFVSFPTSIVISLPMTLFVVSVSLSIMFSTRARAEVARYARRVDSGWSVGNAENESFGATIEAGTHSSVLKGGLACAFAVFTGWAICFANVSLIRAAPPAMPPQLDYNFKPLPGHRFDIVVSMYNEASSDIRDMLSSMKASTPLQGLQPRAIIYTKLATADVDQIKAETGADIVEKLENLGREGGTFLHHIVNKWDLLAEQTLFVQAEVYDMRDVIPQINNFVVPRTGMLSLGMKGGVCDCHSCSDQWDWEDEMGFVPTAYKMVYNRTCTGPVVLSLKGQFVASARRIRGISQDTYRYLLEAVTSKEGWSHDPSFVGDNFDTPDAPYFGYTLERVWSILMQCPDLRVGIMCPNLGRWGLRRDIEDCQCLDPEP